MVPPAPPLRPFVECSWVHAASGRAPRADRRILPDGRMAVVWIRGLGALVAGPQTRFTTRPDHQRHLSRESRRLTGLTPTDLECSLGGGRARVGKVQDHTGAIA